MENSNAFISLCELYQDGDRDWLSLEQLLGEVTYDANEKRYSKSDAQRVKDMIVLLRYLCASGDFEVGELAPGKDGKTKFIAAEKTIDEVCEGIENATYNHGLKNGEFLMGIWLRKLRPGKIPGALNKEVERIFESYEK
jgi:hypothetical protein